MLYQKKLIAFVQKIIEHVKKTIELRVPKPDKKNKNKKQGNDLFL
jgi:hypothetical protein